jgi:flagellar M-ring protein FliF
MAMPLIKKDQIAAQLRGLAEMPLFRQVGLIVGLAATISIGVAIVLWSQEPPFRQLYGGLAEGDSSEVVAALQEEGIEYRINERTGAILVPASRLHETRIALAASGLPKSSGFGFELLEQQSTFGASEFMETARYQHALEGELGRTIESLADVRGVRVHLAIPKRSLFLRDQEKASASVLLNLYPGRTLEPHQAQAIVHLVSSSVPDLERSCVTLIDQTGRLLSSRQSDLELELTMGQFEYSQRLEQAYARRVEEILTPILGRGRVRAQVVVDVDFTVVESTAELHESGPQTLRSEQLTEERTEGSAVPLGIPGALSNQPPSGGFADTGGANGTGSPPVSTSRNSVRNFEVDRTLRHVRSPTGVVKRMSIAVVVDDVVGQDEEGNPIKKPLSTDELNDLNLLVKKAVGFDEQRGDSVHIVNASFQTSDLSDLDSEESFLEQPWFWTMSKQLGGVLLVLVLIFSVLRPVMQSLAEKGEEASSAQQLLEFDPEKQSLPSPAGLAPDQISLSANGESAIAPLIVPTDYGPQLDQAQAVVKDHPKVVANLVKQWLSQ